MSEIGLVSVVIGIAIIVSRAPLIFAPLKTLAVYARLIAHTAYLRIVGVAMTTLGLAAVPTGWRAAGPAAEFVSVVGWVLAVFGVFILLAPDRFRRIGETILATLRDTVDPPILRGVGLIAVALGGFLIHLGLHVL